VSEITAALSKKIQPYPRLMQPSEVDAVVADQDGFEWRAVSLRLDGVPPRSAASTTEDSPASASWSTLDITYD
jgi:hypothetical protein